MNTHDIIYMVDGVEYDRTEDVIWHDLTGYRSRNRAGGHTFRDVASGAARDDAGRRRDDKRNVRSEHARIITWWTAWSRPDGRRTLRHPT